MAGIHNGPPVGEKRKAHIHSQISSKRTRMDEGVNPASKPNVAQLEKQIQQSQQHYNNLVTLLQLARRELKQSRTPRATTAICRVFCRLQAEGRLARRAENASDQDVAIGDWLKERYLDYKRLLLRTLKEGEESQQELALTLGMQLVREESSNALSPSDTMGKNSFFAQCLTAILKSPTPEAISDTYVVQYAQKFHDIRHFTFSCIHDLLNKVETASTTTLLPNCLSLMSKLDPRSQGQEDNYFAERTDIKKNTISSASHKKYAQKAWLAILSKQLDKDQRKLALQIMTHRIVPWIQNVEVLMDFLSDSFTTGGSTSLLALSGLFHLMQTKNLDYPDFYTKLYSLLDDDLLYSKHRSRFFRLLNTFLSSTHLPAVMVASFIKKLSRLSLHAPPAGIVAVVPWVYNMLKTHPTCTFMVHREICTDEERAHVEEHGLDDPFHADEPNPMHTNAIESCLWEIETLQSHYHPNVASLAKIISEQFTKASYNLEDFLDHSYASLIDAELGREMKKTPVVEFEIPRTVFVRDGDGILEDLTQGILSESTL